MLKLGIAALVDYRVDYPLKLRAEIHGNDGGRRFLRAKAVVIARKGDRAAQKLLIFVNALYKRREEQQKRGVLAGGLAGRKEVGPGVRRERPVDMLAGAVHARKRLFVQQTDHAVALCHLFHRLHDELVLVAGGVGVGIYGRHLVLRGGNLVVFRL